MSSMNKKALKIFFFKLIPFLAAACLLVYVLDVLSIKYQFEIPKIVRMLLPIAVFGYAVGKIAVPLMKEIEKSKK